MHITLHIPFTYAMCLIRSFYKCKRAEVQGAMREGILEAHTLEHCNKIGKDEN